MRKKTLMLIILAVLLLIMLVVCFVLGNKADQRKDMTQTEQTIAETEQEQAGEVADADVSAETQGAAVTESAEKEPTQSTEVPVTGGETTDEDEGERV